jgi:prepilin-type N-terminal cleavage/methylation domain-containing protein
MGPSNKNKQTEEGKMTKLVKVSKKGFSLVEVICVIAIICILASVAAFNYLQVFKDCMQALENAF